MDIFLSLLPYPFAPPPWQPCFQANLMHTSLALGPMLFGISTHDPSPLESCGVGKEVLELGKSK